nr:MAG TPA: hypothetical protein [Caudoviricetes sp.]
MNLPKHRKKREDQTSSPLSRSHSLNALSITQDIVLSSFWQ